MKRLIILFVVMVVCVWCVRGQLVWRISGGGVERPSYIVGVDAYGPSSPLDSIAGLRKAWDVVEQVCVVVTGVVDSLSGWGFGDGRSLMDVLTYDEQSLLRPFVKKLYYVDIAESPINKMMPLTLLLSMEYADYRLTAKRMFGFDTERTLKEVLLSMAKDGGLGVVELASRAKYDFYAKRRNEVKMGIKEQKKTLVSYVCGFSRRYEAMIKELEAFRSENLDSIDAHWWVSIAERKDYRRMLNREQKVWVNAIPSMIGERSTLIVLPVSALLDWKEKRSIMYMLREKGYRVEALTPMVKS